MYIQLRTAVYSFSGEKGVIVLYYYVDSSGEIYTERSFPLILFGEHEIGEREYISARKREQEKFE